MNITLDGKQVEIMEQDNNIVEVADRAKVGILASCLRAKRKHGCCKACVVEINGEQQYACATKPVDGMDIIIKRDDLDEIRQERLKAYKENKDVPGGNPCDCACSGDSDCSTSAGCC